MYIHTSFWALLLGFHHFPLRERHISCKKKSFLSFPAAAQRRTRGGRGRGRPRLSVCRFAALGSQALSKDLQVKKQLNSHMYHSQHFSRQTCDCAKKHLDWGFCLSLKVQWSGVSCYHLVDIYICVYIYEITHHMKSFICLLKTLVMIVTWAAVDVFLLPRTGWTGCRSLGCSCLQFSFVLICLKMDVEVNKSVDFHHSFIHVLFLCINSFICEKFYLLCQLGSF